jgi:glucose/arabinose dehydrogenase
MPPPVEVLLKFWSSAIALTAAAALTTLANPFAQTRVPLPTAGTPLTTTAAGRQVRVALVAGGVTNPWNIAFLPGDEGLLVTESGGRLRLVKDGVLAAEPLWVVPPPGGRDVLHGLVLHPDFAQNRLVYVSYVKRKDDMLSVAVARGRLDAGRLADVKDIFVADAWETAANALNGRMIFGPDRTLYLTIGDRDRLVLSDDNSIRMRAQNLADHVGKILRLTDEGGVPTDNPFVGKTGARPEIFTYGHRNPIGMAFHPETSELWISDIGPMGGDRLDILRAGRNYGWPLVSMGRNYTGSLVSDQPWWRPDIEMPRLFWVPSISPASIAFYTGDKIPEWRGNLFVGALSGQQLQRVVIRGGARGGGGQAEQRQPMLTALGLRFRDVRQGPDGYLYMATEVQYGSGKPDGAILRIEPAS